MKIKIISMLTLLLCYQGIAQDQELKIEQMQKLSFMQGEWEGSGWYRGPDGKVSNFNQTENITSKLDGLVMLIEGAGHLESGEQIHHAFAMITFDVESGKFAFNSHLDDGKSVVAEGWFEDERFTWGFPLEQGEIRYAISYSDNKWIETGKYSPDGTQWYPFIEMTLTKK